MDEATAARILEQIDEKETVEFCSELLRIPSFKTEETPVATYLATFFGDRGYDVQLQEVEPGRFQTIATLKGQWWRPEPDAQRPHGHRPPSLRPPARPVGPQLGG